MALKDLISTPLYSDLNVTIDPQRNNFYFFMHSTLSNQTNDKKKSSFDDFNSENEDHIICASTNSMIHNFLGA